MRDRPRTSRWCSRGAHGPRGSLHALGSLFSRTQPRIYSLAYTRSLSTRSSFTPSTGGCTRSLRGCIRFRRPPEVRRRAYTHRARIYFESSSSAPPLPHATASLRSHVIAVHAVPPREFLVRSRHHHHRRSVLLLAVARALQYDAYDPTERRVVPFANYG